jgi:hypothetical protein
MTDAWRLAPLSVSGLEAGRFDRAGVAGAQEADRDTGLTDDRAKLRATHNSKQISDLTDRK